MMVTYICELVRGIIKLEVVSATVKIYANGYSRLALDEQAPDVQAVVRGYTEVGKKIHLARILVDQDNGR